MWWSVITFLTVMWWPWLFTVAGSGLLGQENPGADGGAEPEAPLSVHNGPQLDVPNPVLDLEIKEGVPFAEGNIAFRNVGNGSLRVSALASACTSCGLQAILDKAELGPQEEGHLLVRLDTERSGKSGEWTIDLLSNDPKVARVRLSIALREWKPYTIEPSKGFALGRLPAGDRVHETVRIRWRGERELSSLGILHNPSALQLEITPELPGRVYKLSASMDTHETKGTTTGAIALTNEDRTVRIEVPCDYNVEPDLTISPDAIHLREKGPRRIQIIVRKNGIGRLRCSDLRVSTDIPGLEWKISSLCVARGLVVTADLPERLADTRHALVLVDILDPDGKENTPARQFVVPVYIEKP